jgi:hypothetical protein
MDILEAIGNTSMVRRTLACAAKPDVQDGAGSDD